MKRIATKRDRCVVTTVFALMADHAGDPPHGRVEVKQAFNKSLQKIEQPVAAGDVRQLMCQHRFDLGRGKLVEQSDGQQNHGFEIADGYGGADQCRLEQSHRARLRQPLRQDREACLPFCFYQKKSFVAQSADIPKSACQAQQKQCKTKHPKGYNQWIVAFKPGRYRGQSREIESAFRRKSIESQCIKITFGHSASFTDAGKLVVQTKGDRGCKQHGQQGTVGQPIPCSGCFQTRQQQEQDQSGKRCLPERMQQRPTKSMGQCVGDGHDDHGLD